MRAAIAACLLAGILAAQAPSRYATRVVAYQPGPGGGVFPAANSLGPPQGAGLFAGSLHVADLGAGGSLTLGFDVEICDGPGADLIVFENAFYAAGAWSCWAELCFVEVSSDGAAFARFPALFAGGSGLLPMGCCQNLAGITPVLAHPALLPGVDPFDPCQAGGDAFDLADLGDDPLVKGGKVDLGRIRYVRLVDIVSGAAKDARGRVVYDPGPSADVDAVAAVQHRGNQAPGAPRVAVAALPGEIRIYVSDPDGLQDLIGVRASVNAVAVDPAALLSVFRLVRWSATEVEFALAGLPPGLRFTLGLSVADRAGGFSGARRAWLD